MQTSYLDAPSSKNPFRADPPRLQDAAVQQRRPGDLRPQVRLPRQPGADRRHPPGGRQALPEQRLVSEVLSITIDTHSTNRLNRKID